MKTTFTVAVYRFDIGAFAKLIAQVGEQSDLEKIAGFTGKKIYYAVTSGRVIGGEKLLAQIREVMGASGAEQRDIYQLEDWVRFVEEVLEISVPVTTL